MINQKVQIQTLPAYAGPSYSVPLQELEDILELTPQFDCRKELVDRLIELIKGLPVKHLTYSAKLNSYIEALQAASDSGQLPSVKLKNPFDPLVNKKDAYPAAAFILEPRKNLDPERQNAICRIFLFFVLFNQKKPTDETYHIIRRLLSKPHYSSELLKLLKSTPLADFFDDKLKQALTRFTEESGDKKGIDAAQKIIQALDFFLVHEEVEARKIDGEFTDKPTNKEHEQSSSVLQIIGEQLKPAEVIPFHVNKTEVELSSAWIMNEQRTTSSDYSVLDIEEREYFVSRLIDIIRRKPTEHYDSACLLLLMHSLGCSLDRVLELKYGDDKEITTNGFYRKPIPMPTNSYKPSVEVIGQLPRLQFIELLLPTVIVSWLATLEKKNVSISLMLGRELAVLNEEVQSCLKYIRDGSHFQRLSFKKISTALKNQLYSDYQDEGIRWIIAGAPNHAAATINYYVAYDHKTISANYLNTIKRLFGTHFETLYRAVKPSSSLPIDAVTTYHPNQESVKKVSMLAREALEKAKQSKDIVDIHNAYTDYCLLLLFFATGHRPVDDPFPLMSHIDLTHGFMVISDKVVSPRRAWRIVALPPMAVKQLELYRSYLLKLSARLNGDNHFSDFAERLSFSLQSDDNLVPLFFYLSRKKDPLVSISRSKMEKRWAGFWDWPANYTRHIMATELFKHSLCGGLVKYQLGHNYDMFDHFGVRSTRSVLDVVKVLSPHLEAILTGFGWQPQAIPIYQTTSDLEPEKLVACESIVLAFEKRAEKRKKTQKEANDKIRSIQKKLFPTESIGNLSLTELEKLACAIADDNSVSNSVKRQCLLIIKRNEQKVHRKYSDSAYLRNQTDAMEYSPFSESTVKVYAQACAFRKKFITYLNDKGRHYSFDRKTREIEILVSAVVLGHLQIEELIRLLCSSLSKLLHRIEGEIFIDFTEITKISHFRRWYPDTVTRGLILGYLNQTQISAFSRSITLHEKQISKFLSQLGYEKKAPIDFMIQMAKSLALIELPGFMRANAEFQNFSSSVPLPQLVRLTTNQSIIIKSKSRETKEEPALLPSSTKYPHQQPSFQKASLKNLKALRDCLKEARRPSKDSRANQINKKVKKKRLKELLIERFENEKQWDQKSYLVANYMLDMCKYGTKKEPNCAFSTIDKYSGKIIGLMLLLNDEELPLDDGAYLEELYLNHLKLELKRNETADIKATLNVLTQFHSTLVNNFDAEEVNWSLAYQYAGSNAVEENNTANIVTESEYFAILEAINTFDVGDSITSDQLAFLVILGFRFGVRFGEAYGALRKDVTLGKKFTLWIRQNMHRALKSVSATRFLRQDDEFSSSEMEIIQRYLNAVDATYQNDPNMPLFPDYAANGRVLINRGRATKAIHYVVRELTGDATLRFHSLRHSFASKCIRKIIETECLTESNKLSNEFYSLKEVAVKLGHSDENTTIIHYCHVLDEYLPKLYMDVEDRLDNFGKAYCLQKSYYKIRKQNTNKCNTSFSSFEKNRRAFNLTKQPNIEIKPRDLKRFNNWIPRKLAELSLLELEKLIFGVCSSSGQEITICRQFHVDLSSLEELMELAAKVEKNSQFSSYKATEKLNNAQKKHSSTKNNIGSVDQNKRIRKLFDELSSSSTLQQAAHGVVREYCATWVRTYCAKSNANIIFNSEHLSELQNLQKLTSYNSPAKIIVKSPSQVNYWRNQTSLSNCMVSTGNVRKAFAKYDEEQLRRAKFQLSSKRDNADFARIIFVLTVYLGLKN